MPTASSGWPGRSAAPSSPLPVGETERADPAALEAALLADPAISHVALVYSETGSGMIHDVPALAEAAGRPGAG